MVQVSNGSKYVAEFVGTFMLIFAVGNNVLGGSAVWGATSIACTLMVAIYALGGISGANFNPAVSCALAWTGKMDWGTASAYCMVQLGAGFAAGVAYGLLHWKVFDIGPASGYYWYNAAFAEFIYTFMLCFVVLNVAASKKDGGGQNQYYGLAIGFVIVAGGYGAGHISGGCFNPAVAFGIDISSAALGFGWCFVYAAFELMGAYAASCLFQIIRPEETDDENDAPRNYKIGSKMVSEFIGTYMLVITVGLNVLGGSTAPAFSIAAALMCMIFALGSVSGAHFNPAVTVAIVMSGREKCTSQHGEQYIALQIFGGVLGAFSYAFLENGKTFPLNPGAGHSWFEACTAETVYTFFLCYVVLCVATVQKAPTPDYFGLVIGACVTTGGYAIGALSGGSLNPAVSVGISTSHIINGGNFWHCLVYSLFEIIGGLIAVGLFHVTHPGEYAPPSKDEAALS